VPATVQEQSSARRSARVRTPTVLQMEVVECGAAALGIVLAHYGKFVPLEELRTACGISRDGAKANHIVKAARQLGLVAKGYKNEPEDLPALPLPLIVHWNFSHFVVVEGFGKDKVHLNDPATGPRTVGAEEFNRSFTGVTLVFEKDKTFAPGGARPSALRGLSKRLPSKLSPWAFLTISSLALIVPGMLVPVFSKIFIDNILVGGLSTWLNRLLPAMGITALVAATLTYLQANTLTRLQAHLALVSSSRFVWHVLRLPVEFFAQRFAGDVSARIDSNDTVAALLAGGLSTNLVNLVMIGAYALLMFRYDVRLTLTGILIASANLLVLGLVSRARTDQTRRYLQEQGKFAGASMAGLQMMETLKATGGEAGNFSRWAGLQAKMLNAGQQLGVSSLWLSTAPAILGAINTAAILCLGGLRIIDGSLSIGMLAAFQTLMASFLGPVEGVLALGGSLQSVRGNLTRLDDVLNYPVDAQVDWSGGHVLAPGAPTKLAGEIELRHLVFGYNRLEDPLVKDFNLKVKPGQRVGLVGATGSGKSTMVKLVSGLYAPWEGEVLFDGQPRREIPRDLITNSVAVVDQDIAFFQGTIRENLTMWDSTIEDRDVIQAAKDACIHDDIVGCLGGYHQRPGEGGRNLSGGQRQRLELARALAINPRILILDEATSALDPHTERLVEDNLRRRGCTLLIVAHRLSTIRDCDEIIVMQEGRIVQRGKHDDMIRVPGPYASLLRAG